jgi:hypothetical protein
VKQSQEQQIHLWQTDYFNKGPHYLKQKKKSPNMFPSVSHFLFAFFSVKYFIWFAQKTLKQVISVPMPKRLAIIGSAKLVRCKIFFHACELLIPPSILFVLSFYDEVKFLLFMLVWDFMMPCASLFSSYIFTIRIPINSVLVDWSLLCSYKNHSHLNFCNLKAKPKPNK